MASAPKSFADNFTVTPLTKTLVSDRHPCFLIRTFLHLAPCSFKPASCCCRGACVCSLGFHVPSHLSAAPLVGDVSAMCLRRNPIVWKDDCDMAPHDCWTPRFVMLEVHCSIATFTARAFFAHLFDLKDVVSSCTAASPSIVLSVNSTELS